MEEFYAFRIKAMWQFFWKEHFSFWAICGYLFFEFVRPQSIFPVIDFLPWSQLFIIFAAIGMFLDPTVKWVSSPANKWIILFCITIVIATYITPSYPKISQKYFMFFFGWFVMYFLVINVVNTPKRFYIFISILLVSCAKIAIGTSISWASRGFSFTSWGLMGPQGFFQNSGELSILMLLLFPLAYFFYKEMKDKVTKWERRLLLAFWICPILTILGASSRGAQVALVVMLALIFRKSVFRIKPLVGVVILCAGIFFLLPDEQKERFTEAGEDKTSLQRLLYWKRGMEMIKRHPFEGVGFFNFAPYFAGHYPEDMLYSQAQLPHNIFIQVGTDAGYPAILFFVLLITYCLMTARRLNKTAIPPIYKSYASGLGYGVIGFVIAGQFVTVSYYPFLWINLALLASLQNISQKKLVNNYEALDDPKSK